MTGLVENDGAVRGESDGDQGPVEKGSVLQNKHFLLLWIAQAVSQTAQNAIWYGLIVVVAEATKSTTQLGFAVLTTILPAIVFGLIAGVVVDRVNKKSVLVTTNLLRGLAVFGYLLYGHAIYFVYAVNLIFCSIGQFFGPAEASTIPQLLPKRQLITANSLFNLTFTGSQIAGLVLIAPPVIKLFGAPTLFVVSALAYFLAAGLVSFLPTDVSAKRARPVSGGERAVGAVWAEIREGWGFIRADAKTALAMVHLTLVSGLVLVMSILAPRFVVDVLGIRADDAVFILAPTGAGILVGTMLVGRLAGRFGKPLVVKLGLFVMGSSMMLLALLQWLSSIMPPAVANSIGQLSLPRIVGLVPAVVVLVAVMGFNFALVTIPSQTVIMERAPVATRGRIFAVQMMLGNLVSVVPLLFFGGFADLFGVEAAMGLVAIAILAVAVYSASLNRRQATGNAPAALAADAELQGRKGLDPVQTARAARASGTDV